MYGYEEAWIMTAQLNEKKDGCELCMRPLVFCKDCRWYDEQISMCDNCGLPREQTFFCADGEMAVKS